MIRNTSNAIKAYSCSKKHGNPNPESFCGTFLYEELEFTSPKEIVIKRDYDYIVLDASAENSTGEMLMSGMLETFQFGF